MIFEKLKDLIETRGKETGDNYSLYNFNNPLERLDYDKVTGVVTYTRDNYVSHEDLLNYIDGKDDEFLTVIYNLFNKVGSKYDYDEHKKFEAKQMAKSAINETNKYYQPEWLA